MYTTHFKMKTQPFAERIPTTQILKDERITQGLARLQYMTSHGTIALITGMTGIGKSTLIKLFLSNLSQIYYHPVYIHFTHVKASSLLKLIVSKLDEIPKTTKGLTFTQIIDKTRKLKQNIILIIDEAHLLESDALTDLRLLLSSVLDDVPPLKIILAGQEGIKDKLKRSAHADFSQRISIYCRLKPMTKAQTAAYIDFQMNYAGASEKIFEPEVKEMIHEYSNGIPRQINNIAIGCLLNASIEKTQKINLSLLNQTMGEFQS